WGFGRAALLDEPEHERHRAELEVGGRLEAVGVADDEVEAPPALRVGVRLVTSVDDGASQRRLEPDLSLDVVGSLRELEAGPLAALPDADAAGAREHGSRHEERHDSRRQLAERHGAVDEEVLVRAVRRTLAVDVVLVEH